MSKTVLKYEGNAKIYLQGAHGAVVITNLSREHVDMAIGSESSQINIRDRRKATVDIINRIMIDGQDDFVDTFNKPAFVHVFECEKLVTIDLDDTLANPEAPTLWLGVIYDNKMPAYETSWEVMRGIENDEVAFAALITEEVGE